MMKLKIFIIITVLFCAWTASAYQTELGSISSSLSQSLSKSGKKSVAVVDFTDLQGNTNELGRFIAEELSVDLTNKAKGLDVIDRNHLKSIFKEHKFSASGLVDPKTIKKLGRIIGTDAIVTGSITPFGDTIRVTCKVIATDTAKIIGSTKGDIAKTKAIEDLMNKGIGDTNDTPPTKIASSDKPARKKDSSKFIIEGKDFVIELVSVNLSDMKYFFKLDFNFKVTNNGRARRFEFPYGYSGEDSIVLDNFGNSLRLPTCAGAEIPSGQSKNIKCFIQDGVSGQTKSLDIYRGSYSVDSRGYEQFEFRNIPVVFDKVDRWKNVPEKYYR